MAARELDEEQLHECISVVVAGRRVAVLERTTSKRGMFPFRTYLTRGDAREYLGEWYDRDDALAAVASALDARKAQ